MERFGRARLVRGAILLGLGLLAIFIEAAPIGHRAGAPPSPDLLFLVVAHFSVRRPGTAVLFLVFLLGLVRDLMTDLPPGIGALTLVAVSEVLKSFNQQLRRVSFAFELAVVALAAAAILAVQWLAVVLVFVPPPPVSVLMQQWAITVAIYPVLALVLRWMFRIGWKKPERV